MGDDDWKSWKNGKYDNRYKGVKRHSGKSNTKRIIVVSLIIICALIGGYFIFQIYGTPQNIQNEAGKIINNTGSTIQRLSSQSQQSISNLQNSVTSTNERVPVAVYDDCKSFVRTDLKTIGTTCYGTKNNPQYKQFTFNLPTVLEQGLQPNQVLLNVNSKVYQYDTNDFELGLFDQVGEKNYTVSLWQLPK